MDKKLILLLVIAVVLLGGALAIVGPRSLPDSEKTQPTSSTPSLDPVSETYQFIKDNFYQPDKIDNQKLISGSIRGMIQQLDDPWSVFFTPDQFKRFFDPLEEKPFVGIGVYINLTDGQLTIIKPITGGPAVKAGVRAGDIVLEIDGQSTQGITLDEASAQLRGQPGSSVNVKVQHLDGAVETVKIDRAEIQVPSVEYRLLDGGTIGYLKITAFNGPTASEASQALQAVEKNPVQGLILDLRDNTGGFLESAVDVSSLFIDNGVILTEQTRAGVQTYSSKGNSFPNLPLVILVNRNTASAAEITAGALRDQSMGILIGEKTFGKGVVQTTHQFSDGSAIKLTIGEYHTPLGRKVQGIGLAADIPVTQPDDPLAKMMSKLHDFAGLFPSDDQNVLQILTGLQRQSDEIQIQLESDQFDAALAAAQTLQSNLEAARGTLTNDGGLIAQQQIADISSILTQLETTLAQNDFTTAVTWLKAHAGERCPCKLPPLPSPQTPPSP